MATVNKIKVGSTIYDVSPSPTGTLDNTAYTSGDTAQSSATSWTSVNQIVATETNASIFTKITQMIRNVRYLYNLIGTGTFSTTNTITKVVNNKANSSHSHTTAQLPTSNTQINSTAYVPTSALVYSMNQTLNELNDALSNIEDSIGPELPYKVYPIKWNYTSSASYCTCPSSYFNYNNIYIFILLYNKDSEYRCKVAALVGNGNSLQFQYYSGENTINVTGGGSGKFTSFESDGYSKFYISGETANITISTGGGGGGPYYSNDGIIIEIIK